MFFVKSAFWLTIGFLLVAPHGVDLGQTAREASADALEAGQKLIVSQILETGCLTLQCAGDKLISAASASSPSFDPAMQDSSNNPVPFPRPRPDWMG